MQGWQQQWIGVPPDPWGWLPAGGSPGSTRTLCPLAVLLWEFLNRDLRDFRHMYMLADQAMCEIRLTSYPVEFPD